LDEVTHSAHSAKIGRHREVVVVTSRRRCQPLALLIDRRVPNAAQFFDDPVEERPLALTPGLATELEALAVPLLLADMDEAKEVERVGLLLVTPLASLGHKAAKLDEARLFLGETERNVGEPLLQVAKEHDRIAAVLEADNRVISIAHDDHVAGSVTPPPHLNPQIVDIMEVDVRKQRRYHRPLRRPLARLDHRVALSHTRPNPFGSQADTPF